jgi:DNA-binding transcriptional MerR regulator
MSTLPQMALNFTTVISPPQKTAVSESQDPPVNVGVRLKKLKVQEPDQKPKPAGPAAEKIKSSRGRKSISQVAAEADLIKIPEDEVLFRKQYYTMGEVADMFRVNQSLLRFWETEFSVIQPKKNKKGDRYFRPEDIKSLHLIYHLLRQRKYTIEGAKDFLKNNKKAEERFEMIKNLEQIRSFLLELRTQL